MGRRGFTDSQMISIVIPTITIMVKSMRAMHLTGVNRRVVVLAVGAGIMKKLMTMVKNSNQLIILYIEVGECSS